MQKNTESPRLDSAPASNLTGQGVAHLADRRFHWFLVGMSVVYVLLLILLVAADVAFVARAPSAAQNPQWSAEHPVLAWWVDSPLGQAIADSDIRYSIWLTLLSCTITAIVSVWIAVPIGYLMSRHDFRGKRLVDAMLDLPIFLPPLVVGLSLLILFQYFPTFVRDAVVYQVPAVILAQLVVTSALAIRTMRAVFDQLDTRQEQVALTMGCNRRQAFWWVVVPEAGPGILTAGTLAWARALGEFGPLLVFAGATRGKTEVLSTTVFLELSIGNLPAAVAVSLLMIAAAVAVLTIARTWGVRTFGAADR